MSWSMQNNNTLNVAKIDNGSLIRNEEDRNYCRNPDMDVFGPWCYIEPHTKQYCPIPICDVSDELNEMYTKQPFNSYRKTKLWDIANYIRIITFPILLLFGGLLNTLSVAVFTRPSLRKLTTSYILICLAIFDTLSLYSLTLTRWLKTITGKMPEAQNNLSCQIYWFFMHLFSMISNWLLVLVTLERLAAVLKPQKAKIICSSKNIRMSIFGTVVCCIPFCIPVIFGYESRTDFIFDEDDVHFVAFTACWYCCSMLSMYIRWTVAWSHGLIPFFSIFIGNFVLSVITVKAHMKRKIMLTYNQAKSDEKGIHSLNKGLLLVTFAYLVFTSPYVIYMFIFPLTIPLYESRDAAICARELWAVLVVVSLDINRSINFILYCIAGRRFRQVFFNMCGCVFEIKSIQDSADKKS